MATRATAGEKALARKHVELDIPADDKAKTAARRWRRHFDDANLFMANMLPFYADGLTIFGVAGQEEVRE